MLLALLLCCAIGDPGPATPGSPSARAVDEVAELRRLAGEIEAMAIEVEEQAQAARGLTDPAARAAAAAEARHRLDELAAREEALRTRLAALEQGLHAQAGDPAPPVAE